MHACLPNFRVVRAGASERDPVAGGLRAQAFMDTAVFMVATVMVLDLTAELAAEYQESKVLDALILRKIWIAVVALVACFLLFVWVRATLRNFPPRLSRG